MTEPTLTTISNPIVAHTETAGIPELPDFSTLPEAGGNPVSSPSRQASRDTKTVPSEKGAGIDVSAIFRKAEAAARKEQVDIGKSIYTINTDRYKGMNLSQDLATNLPEVEFAAAAAQPWYESVWNDVKVTGVNFGAMFAVSYTSIFDNLKNQSLLASPDSLTAKIGEWRNRYEEENSNFQSRRQADHPIASMLLTTNGLGELFKSVGYSLGSATGIASQIYLTGGLGAGIGALARGTAFAPSVANGVRGILNSKKIADSLAGALGLSRGASAGVNTLKGIESAVNVAKKVVPSYLGAYGEAAFEGLESSEKLKADKAAEYYNAHNSFPEADYKEEINKVAHEAFDARFSMNLAMLMISNMPLLKVLGRSYKGVRNGLEDAARMGYKPSMNEFGKITLQETAPRLAQSTVSGFVPRALFAAKNNVYPALKELVKKTDITWSEGLEELYQHWVGTSTDNYYSSLLDVENNERVERSIMDNALGLFQQMGRDRGELTSIEGIKSLMSGIVAGTGQQAFSKLLNSYKFARDDKGKRILVNIAQQHKKAFEAQIPAIENELNKNLEEYLNFVSITGRAPSAFSETVKGTTKLYNNQNLANSEVGFKQTQWATLFMNTYEGIAMGQADILSDILNNQFKGMSLPELNSFLNNKGLSEITEEGRETFIKNLGREIYKVRDTVNKIKDTLSNPFSENSEAFKYYEEVQKLAAYHTYMAENSREFSENFKSKTSMLAQDVFLEQGLSLDNTQKKDLIIERKIARDELLSLKDIIKSAQPGDLGLEKIREQAEIAIRKLDILDKLIDKDNSLKLSAEEIAGLVADFRGYETPTEQEVLDAINLFKLKETNNKHSKIVKDLIGFDPRKEDAAVVLSSYIREAMNLQNNMDSVKRESKIVEARDALKSRNIVGEEYQRAFSKMVLEGKDIDTALAEVKAEELSGSSDTPFLSGAYDEESVKDLKVGDTIDFQGAISVKITSIVQNSTEFIIGIELPSVKNLNILEIVYSKTNAFPAFLNVTDTVINAGAATFKNVNNKEEARNAINLVMMPILEMDSNKSFIYPLEDFDKQIRHSIQAFRKLITDNPSLLSPETSGDILAAFNAYNSLGYIFEKYTNKSIIAEAVEEKNAAEEKRKEEEARRIREEQEALKRAEEEARRIEEAADKEAERLKIEEEKRQQAEKERLLEEQRKAEELAEAERQRLEREKTEAEKLEAKNSWSHIEILSPSPESNNGNLLSTLSSKLNIGVFFLEEDEAGLLVRQATPKDPEARAGRATEWLNAVAKFRQSGLQELVLVKQFKRAPAAGKKGNIFYYPAENNHLLIVDEDNVITGTKFNLGLAVETNVGQAVLVDIRQPNAFKVSPEIFTRVINFALSKGATTDTIDRLLPAKTESEIDNKFRSLVDIGKFLYNTEVASVEELAKMRYELISTIFNGDQTLSQATADSYFMQAIMYEKAYNAFEQDYLSSSEPYTKERLNTFFDFGMVAFGINSVDPSTKKRRPAIPISQNPYPIIEWEGVKYNNLVHYKDQFYTVNSDNTFSTISLPRSLRDALFIPGKVSTSEDFVVIQTFDYKGNPSFNIRYTDVPESGSGLEELVTYLNSNFKKENTKEQKSEAALWLTRNYKIEIPNYEGQDKKIFIKKVSPSTVEFTVKFKGKTAGETDKEFLISVKSDPSLGITSSVKEKGETEKNPIRIVRRKEFVASDTVFSDFRFRTYSPLVIPREEFNIGQELEPVQKPVEEVIPEDLPDNVDPNEVVSPNSQIDIDFNKSTPKTIVRDFSLNNEKFSVDVERAFAVAIENDIISSADIVTFYKSDDSLDLNELRQLIREGLADKFTSEELVKKGVLSDNSNPSFRDLQFITPELDLEINRLINLCLN